VYVSCCRGDETLGRKRGALETEHDRGRGAAGDGAAARGGAWRDGGSSAAGLTPGRSRDGIEA
jgi:hypothetical protein